VDALESKPEMTPFISWYLNVYFFLSNSRQQGFSGAAPIPLSEITNYFHNFPTVSDIEMFSTVIMKMDEAYLSHVQKKQESKRATKGKGTPK